MMGRTRFLILLTLVAVVGLVFAALNLQPIAIELAVVRVRMPLGLALVLACGIGMLVGVSMRGAWVAELLSERGRLRRALKAAEARARHHAAAKETSG